MKIIKITIISLFIFSIVSDNSIGNTTPIIHYDSITISNISISNLEHLDIYSKYVENSSGARALASDTYYPLAFKDPNPFIADANTTSKGYVSDFSDSGNAYAIASLNYTTAPDSIFRGSTYSLSSSAIVNDFGHAISTAGFAEIISFKALASTDVTFSFEYFGDDDRISNISSNSEWSSAGISFNIGNTTESFSQGLAASLADAMSISPGILSTTVHFHQGDFGWFSLIAQTHAEINRSYPTNPVPEPATLVLLSTCMCGLVCSKIRRKK